MRTNDVKDKKQVYVFMLLFMLICTAVFLNSLYWPYEEISKRKILVVFFAFASVIIVPVLSVKSVFFYENVNRIIRCIKNSIVKTKKEKKRISILVLMIIGGGGLSHIATVLISRYIQKNTYNIHLFCLCVTIFALVISSIFMWKSAAKKVENVFLVVALILGVFCISVTPSRVGVTWDDEKHYAWTLEISNWANGVMYEADEKNIRENVDNINGRTGYDRQSDNEYAQELKNLYETKACEQHEFSDYGVWSISYIPAAIGIIIARGIGLSYIGVFNMGRFFNLLMYVLLIYFAIKKIKYGKVLVSAIGLLPATLFMAANYSYDAWVTGFTILGFAYFFSELQDDVQLENKNILIMVGAVMLGCMPKAIYFPILFPMLFMPLKKFKSMKQRRGYYLFIIGAGVFLVATFLLPILFNGMGTGDVRGGAGVNSTEQLKFILNNPLAYLKILLKFELDYLSMGTAGVMLQGFGYVGIGRFYGVVWLILAVLTFLDRGENEKNYIIAKSAGMIGCVVAIVLATTALYISYTAVGANTVAGMQGRYLIPTIYPALYSLGIGGTTHKINKNAFVYIPILILAVTFVYNVSQFCVIHY